MHEERFCAKLRRVLLYTGRGVSRPLCIYLRVSVLFQDNCMCTASQARRGGLAVVHSGGFGGGGCSVSYCGGPGLLVHQHGRGLLRGPGVELRHCGGDAAVEVNELGRLREARWGVCFCAWVALDVGGWVVEWAGIKAHTRCISFLKNTRVRLGVTFVCVVAPSLLKPLCYRVYHIRSARTGSSRWTASPAAGMPGAWRWWARGATGCCATRAAAPR